MDYPILGCTRIIHPLKDSLLRPAPHTKQTWANLLLLLAAAARFLLPRGTTHGPTHEADAIMAHGAWRMVHRLGLIKACSKLSGLATDAGGGGWRSCRHID